jgi:hypothetical protein
VSRELGFRDAGVGTVALLLPLQRKPGAVETRLPHAVPVGAENSSTSGDLDVFVDQPTETIDPLNPHIGCWSG